MFYTKNYFFELLSNISMKVFSLTQLYLVLKLNYKVQMPILNYNVVYVCVNSHFCFYERIIYLRIFCVYIKQLVISKADSCVICSFCENFAQYQQRCVLVCFIFWDSSYFSVLFIHQVINFKCNNCINFFFLFSIT